MPPVTPVSAFRPCEKTFRNRHASNNGESCITPEICYGLIVVYFMVDCYQTHRCTAIKKGKYVNNGRV